MWRFLLFSMPSLLLLLSTRVGCLYRLEHSYHPHNYLGKSGPDPSLNEVTSEGGKLLDLDSFKWLSDPISQCSEDKLYFLVLVHTKPDHFQERRLIRETWGSVAALQGWQMRVVFLMGQAAGGGEEEGVKKDKEDEDEEESNSVLKSRSLHHDNTFFNSNWFDSRLQQADSIDKLVTLESTLQGDIVRGNFLDTTGNQTYKHVMGYKWVVENCKNNQPRFVIKTDDKVFVEIFHLFNFVSAIYGSSPGPSLICDVVPAGTGGHRQDRKDRWRTGWQSVQLDQDLDTGLLPHRSYPKYCSGAAYLITPDLMSKFLEATEELPPMDAVIPDDVYMTGMIREYLHISPFYLNLRYSYEQGRARRWLNSLQPFTPLPFIFVVHSVIAQNRDWTELARSLWDKTVRIQQDFHRMQ